MGLADGARVGARAGHAYSAVLQLGAAAVGSSTRRARSRDTSGACRLQADAIAIDTCARELQAIP